MPQNNHNSHKAPVTAKTKNASHIRPNDFQKHMAAHRRESSVITLLKTHPPTAIGHSAARHHSHSLFRPVRPFSVAIPLSSWHARRSWALHTISPDHAFTACTLLRGPLEASIQVMLEIHLGRTGQSWCCRQTEPCGPRLSTCLRQSFRPGPRHRIAGARRYGAEQRRQVTWQPGAASLVHR